jgi:hypothetical protein
LQNDSSYYYGLKWLKIGPFVHGIHMVGTLYLHLRKGKVKHVFFFIAFNKCGIKWMKLIMRNDGLAPHVAPHVFYQRILIIYNTFLRIFRFEDVS